MILSAVWPFGEDAGFFDLSRVVANWGGMSKLKLAQSLRLASVFACGLAALGSLSACSSSDGSSDGNTAGSSNAAAGMSAGGASGSGGQSALGGGGAAAAGASSAGASNAGSANAGAANGGAAGSSGSGGATGMVGPRFSGRFDVTKPTAPVFEWSGASIALRFKGTAIGVTLADGTSDVFEAIVDGKHTVVPMTWGSKKYSLATGLTDGPHDVLLYRRTEAFFGDTTFQGFDVDPSAYLPLDAPPAHKLEVIGDSISAGYGDEGTFPCTFSAATENHYLTYEALAARAVDAELYTEAWSGIGMYRNNDGTTTGTMPERYGRTLPVKDTQDTWDFSKFVPDAVVVNLGTNDFAKGDPGMVFQTTYVTFVTMLRGHYPKARIYLAVGPMLGGESYTGAKNYLNAVIAARAAEDKNLALLELGTQDQADGLGCDYHPSLATHQKMADKLVAALKADLGF